MDELSIETVAVPVVSGVVEALPETAADKELTCPICMRLLDNTFLTACGHSFCSTCISTHLQNKSECPCCAQFLTTSQLYPNFLLDKLLKKASARQLSETASPVEQFRHSLEQGCKVSAKELNRLLALVSERKRKLEREAPDENFQILLNFLNCVNEHISNDLNEVQNDLLHINEDVSAVERRIFALHRARERCSCMPKLVSDDPTTSMDINVSGLMYNSHNEQREVASGNFQDVGRVQVNLVGTQSIDASFTGPISQHTKQSASGVLQKRCVPAQFNELQEIYLQKRRQSVEKKYEKIITREGYSPGLDDFQSVLSTYTRYSRLQVIAEIGHEYTSRSANVVSSIEFDRDDELFATAGASRRIKVYDFASVVNEPTDVYRPVVDMATRSKLSCLSWNKFSKYQMASSDYDGTVTVWDVNTQQSIMDYEEHMRRAWSVDFSRTEPSMLVSGSNDCTVKVWCTNQEASVLNIDMRSSVCSVKYNPESSNFIAVGADRHVYYYDLRNPCNPLYVLRGHKKAVSYVRFLSNNELASASIDSSLRLWDVKQNLHMQSFRGHKNEMNFVGLTVSNDFLACGSEANSVVVYHKAISKPVTWHEFGYPGLDDEEDAKSYFVSAVCWKSDGPTMLAANSKGTIKALVLAH